MQCSVQEDPEREVRRVLSFLRIAPDSTRLACMRGRRFENFLRRRRSLEESPYWGDTQARVREAMKVVQGVLEWRGQQALPLHLYTWQ